MSEIKFWRMSYVMFRSFGHSRIVSVLAAVTCAECYPAKGHNKCNEIDALVMTTAHHVRQSERFDREHGRDLPRDVYAERAAPWFEVKQ